jgi:(E)-4-hydroxy-3-methylbut-2-enyl-diphosphate synthase
MVRSVVGLIPRRDTEKMLYETALRVGSLFTEDLAEAVLLPAPTLFRGVGRQAEVTRETLGILGRYPRAFTLISCPTCGRCQIDIPRMAERVHRLLRKIETRYRSGGVRLESTGGIMVAVMGCNVNGPGEARGADIGIAGGKRGTGTIFREGKPVATLSGNKLLTEFEHRLLELVEDRLRSSATSAPGR